MMLMKISFYIAVLVLAFLGYQRVSHSATSLKVGDIAPDFSLPDAKGNLLTLASLKNRWVVLYFYPKDDTPGCTKEACHFRDDLHQLEKLGATVVGISVDDGKSHTEFAKKYNLPFPLLSDTNGDVAKKYDALTNLGIVKIAKRYTYLIDPAGVVKKTYFSVDTSKHSQQIIDDLTRLQASSK
jgi:thioredoxin-dependent peroxiredoxin